MAYQTSHSEK